MYLFIFDGLFDLYNLKQNIFFYFNEAFQFVLS